MQTDGIFICKKMEIITKEIITSKIYINKDIKSKLKII